MGIFLLSLFVTIFGVDVEFVSGPDARSLESVAIVTCRMEDSLEPSFVAQQPVLSHELVNLTIAHVIENRTAQYEDIGVDRVWLWGPGLNNALRVGPHNRGGYYRLHPKQRKFIKDYDVICDTDKATPLTEQ